MAKLDTVSTTKRPTRVPIGALTTMAKKIRVNGARFMFWVLASRAPSWPTRCFSSVSLRSTHQAEVASSITDEIFQEKTMSNYRYYIVGDCHIWCMQYASAELALASGDQDATRSNRPSNL